MLIALGEISVRAQLSFPALEAGSRFSSRAFVLFPNRGGRGRDHDRGNRGAGFVAVTTHVFITFTPQTRFALQALVPLELFPQMALMFALANAANMLCAVVLALMVVS